ncbi:hypothetical protein [Streptacidiphilus melanogenes]|uniref:hypothetical protein n=1 Tax=Streptacidiphilus melanogenes TaxID=411235 RepID=UPI0005A665FA|nr:hypothetical protein [Streptacidiphilus melanogenes]
MHLKKKFGALVATTMLAAGLGTVTAPAAHAATCGSERVLASNVTTLKSTEGSTLGQLYLGYIPSCRMMYAEVHWDDSSVTNSGPGSIWISDQQGNQAGKRYYSDKYQGVSGSFWTSNLVAIDQFGYRYSMPHVYASWLHGVMKLPPFVYPKCLTNHDFHGEWHDWYRGANGTDHPTEGC